MARALLADIEKSKAALDKSIRLSGETEAYLAGISAKLEWRHDSNDGETKATAVALADWPLLEERHRVFELLEKRCTEVTAGHGISSAECHGAAADETVDISVLTYGEMSSMPAFCRMLARAIAFAPAVPRDGTAKFADLGCGSGRALAAAALLPGSLPDAPASNQSYSTSYFGTCLGIELLPGLACAARKVASTLSELGVFTQMGASVESGSRLRGIAAASARIEVVHGDMFETVDLWSSADVIYLASSCFTDKMLSRFFKTAAAVMRAGSLLISLKVPKLGSKADEVLQREFHHKIEGPCVMSWGPATIHVLVRRGGPSPFVVQPPRITAHQTFEPPPRPSSQHLSDKMASFMHGADSRLQLNAMD